jgi:hypothetical protein
MEDLARHESLFEGLNPDEQRRLYFLLLAVDQFQPREALALAQEIDAFVTASGGPPVDADPSARDKGPAKAENGQRETGAGSASPSFNETPQGSVRPGKLDRASRMDFFKAAAQGATNAELAERFGLTKRQAHALRIGMVRGSRPGQPPTRKDSQAVAESSAYQTEEGEIIRFLRQVGDVVVKENDVFVVNSILRLSFRELVERANAKRLQRGKPRFEIPRLETRSDVDAPNGNGAGGHRS